MDRIVRSLAAKLILTIGVLLLLSVGILFYKLVTAGEKNLVNNAIKQTASYSDFIKKSLYYDMLTFHREAIQHTIESMGSINEIIKINIFDKKGEIAYSTAPGEIGQFIDKNSFAYREFRTGHLTPSETLKSRNQWTISKDSYGYRTLIFVDPIYNDFSCYTASCHVHSKDQKILGVMQTEFSLLSVDNDIRDQTLSITVSATIFMAVTSTVLFLFLLKFVHSPISHLSKAMRQITQGNTGQRVEIHSGDEIGALAATFNAMSENLEKTAVSRDLLAKEVKERKEAEVQLLGAERFLNTIFESIQEPFIILDRDYKIVRANTEYARLRGIPVPDLLGKHCHQILHGKDVVCDNCVVEKTFRSADPCSMDKMIQSADGTQAWFDIYTFPITDEHGHVSHVIEYLQDISHRKRAEKAIKNAYIELEQIFNTAADGMCVIDDTFKIVRVNKTLLTMFGESKDKVVGKNCYDIFPEQQCNTSECPLTMIRGGADHHVQFESEKKRIDGTSLYLIVTATAFRGADGEFLGIVQNCKDISIRKNMEEELRSLSLRDELTGLYNRRGFLAFAEREFKIADRLKRRIFLLYADVDGLKVINDTLGHTAGDGVIREAASVLQETFRSYDIIGRIGGDEFVVLPIGWEEDKIGMVTARLQKNIEMKNDMLGRTYKLALSIGVAKYDPENPVTINELLIQADALMYQQKKNRRKSC